MPPRSSEISFFLSFCIEQYKQAHNLTGEQSISVCTSKRNTMGEITQDNLYLLLPSKVSWVADMLSEDEHISTIEAIRRVYSSAMYKELEQESTKRWHEGPVSLYQTI